jgi:ubiquinone/menaquinone biosynthesis C-methylase UbiE
MAEGEVRRGWRFPPERRHVLWDEDRQQRLPPDPILKEAGIAPGMTVVDVGAGTGYWTLPLSTTVGAEGRVIAVDVEPIMVEDLRSLVRERGLTNVEVVTSQEAHIPLGDGIADLALMAFVLHEPPDPAAMLREVFRLLRSGGRLLLLEWQKWETQFGPPVEHRVSAEEARDLLNTAGFNIQQVEAPNQDYYIYLGTV